MGRSLYSLILSDEVVAELDRAALRAGTNRSQLANRILAEHLSLLTPEKRIEEVFQLIDRFFNEGAEMVSRFVPHQPTLQLKTSLSYRYRPTLRYELRLYPEPVEGRIGEIHMILRTQAEDLLLRMEAFAKAWIEAERSLLTDPTEAPAYELGPGRFSRTIRIPQRDIDPASFSEALSVYVQLLDESFKAYINGRMNAADIRNTLYETMKGESV